MLNIEGLRLLILVLVLVFGCRDGFAAEAIRDLSALPQDARAYLSPANADRMAVTPEEQERLDTRYNEAFFSPWRRTEPHYGAEKIVRSFKRYRKYLGYAENGRRHTPEWISDLLREAQLETFPNAGYAGMTVRRANMRVLPTKKPRFLGLNVYNFDLFQTSSVPVNTPVYVTHTTRDKAWVMVETAWACGWLPTEDVARVDEEHRRSWERGPYLTVIHDQVPVHDLEEGAFLFYASLGTMFPLVKAEENGWQILVTVANEKNRAVVRTAWLTKPSAVRKPLPLTPRFIAGQINELIRGPYSWGGLNGNRDCSSTLKDLFAPFGIWLPRNSAAQARQGGGVINLKRLKAQAKEEQILKRGIPFLTLLWEPGHIMLYIGSTRDETLVFHNFWAVKTRDRLGRVLQKVIVGEAAITSLHPGRELQKKKIRTSDRLNDLWAMTLLVPPSP